LCIKIGFIYDAVYLWVKGGAEKRVYEIEVHLSGLKWGGEKDNEDIN